MVRRHSAGTPFVTSAVASADGTEVGYRRYGAGPGVVLVHGGMMAAQDFHDLAARLAPRFTAFVPDLRGRGMSGAFTVDHSLQKEVEDLAALLDATGARMVFALSAGAIFALEAALRSPIVERLAVYESPFPLTGEESTVGWLPEYEQRLAAGDLGGALIAVARGTGDTSLLVRLPRVLTARFMDFAIRAQAAEVSEGDVSLRDRIVSVGRDAEVVAASRDRLGAFQGLSARVLLMRGTRSPRNLRAPIDALHQLLPGAEYWVLPRAGHLAPVRGRRSATVADRLAGFFTREAAGEDAARS